MPVISTDALTKRFGTVTAVDNLSLSIGDGAFYGFVGPNGAGKTTTINVLTGQLVPTAGTVSVLGLDPVEHPVKVRERVGILPEREDPPSFLTPREYFDFVADVRNIPDVDARVAEWVDRLAFTEKLDTVCMDLSKGEKQKVMLVQAFLHEPELVFIDEPLINLDPIMQERIKTFFQDYRERGNTLFLSTHVLSLAEEVCTQVGILDRGTLVTELDMDELRDGGDRLIDVFLDEVERFEAAQTDDA